MVISFYRKKDLWNNDTLCNPVKDNVIFIINNRSVLKSVLYSTTRPVAPTICFVFFKYYFFEHFIKIAKNLIFFRKPYMKKEYTYFRDYKQKTYLDKTFFK